MEIEITQKIDVEKKMALQENLWVICAITGIKWIHLADMYGPTYNESNNN